MDEYGNDPFTAIYEDPENAVTAVLPHPLHGRLVERVILWVRPTFTLKGRLYKLTWWGDGIAYYQPLAS
jgi:hypothetical protein